MVLFLLILNGLVIKERQKQEEPRCELANITAQGSVCGFDYLCLIYLKENTATKVFHLSSPYISWASRVPSHNHWHGGLTLDSILASLQLRTQRTFHLFSFPPTESTPWKELEPCMRNSQIQNVLSSAMNSSCCFAKTSQLHVLAQYKEQGDLVMEAEKERLGIWDDHF